MRQIFIVICFAFAVICEAQNNTAGSIKGIVEGYPKLDANLLLSTLEEINPTTEKEFDKIFVDFNKKYGQKIPLCGEKIVLRGGNIQRETQTDNNGNFNFDNLPYGKYLLLVIIPNWIGIYTDTKMPATASKYITIDSQYPQHVILTPDVIHVDLYGKVINHKKQPVEGAKVIARWVHSEVSEEENIPTWEAVTDENGNYEFKALRPANWLRVAGALLSKQRSIDGVEITVVAENSNDSTSIIIPLISQDILYLAKRLSAIMEKALKTSDIKYPQDMNTFEKILPKSEGNTIFVDDIVLDKEVP